MSLGALGLCAADKKAPAEPSIVAGTVFREPGFALADAEVKLFVKAAPEGVKVLKVQKTRSNFRGEYSFNVPAAKAEYVIRVKAPGFVPHEKFVVLGGDPERIEIYVTLKLEISKGK